MEIKIGTAGTASRTVTEKDTALAVKSGSLQVLATPVLSALMEEAAVAALAPCLRPKQTTVGGFIAVRHKAPAEVKSVSNQKACQKTPAVFCGRFSLMLYFFVFLSAARSTPVPSKTGIKP